ncbi:BT_3044 domain-containing protein [Bacteroides finegoldii]|jgi:hypothetical protein|uniref:Domain of uncharacterized function (DUF1735) n=1 Tax=Bacteroides finegoldii TaxID=338188 RepID=A0A173ZJD2_9BACE|nr:DUF4361 domain-containing protein [Bacteroides finegoldii]CDC53462.1 putative uncharacterized protein [Bacteroides finegoldii CAG:203]CUN76512.1 Domain of uncharacterised function (DUF1735) [Bacteroides finegoldii]
MKQINILKKKFAGCIGLLLIGLMTACEQEFYKDEQYRKEIYIVSGDDNIFGQEFTFGEETTGYLSIYAGGATSVEHDVEVELAKNVAFLQEYNQRVKGEDYNNYAIELATDRYVIDDMTVTLKPDVETPYSLCPIRVNIEGLYPDETYFIPLKIASVSDYMISEERRNVLFQIFMKNDYATTKTDTYYTMSGTSKKVGEERATPVNATKLVVPISRYAIRILPASTQTTDKLQLRKQGIVVVVNPDETVDVPVLDDEGMETGQYLKMQKVTLKPWIDSQESVEVQDVTDKSSYYDSEKKEYTLFYRYKLYGSNDWFEMKEVMRPLNSGM